VNLAYISPSALETFEMCERKWAWSKLDRIPKVMGESAALGDAVHKQHERWLRDGIPYDLSKREGVLAMATMHLLPAPGVANVELEVIYDWRAASGAVYRLGGKIDAHWFEESLIVLDHKTTGAIGFRKDTREKLIAHPQAPIYATWGFQEREADIKDESLELRWNYVDTKPKRPKPYPSWHTLHADETARAMAHVVEPVARRLLERVEQANGERRAGRPFAARHLPMNTNVCSAFGGCQFRSRCQLTPSQEFTAHMTQQASSFLARLNIQPGGGAPAPSPAPAAAPVVTHVQAAAPGVEGYGAAINPPESAAPVQQAAADAAAEQAAAATTNTEIVPATPAAGGKGKGSKKAPAAPATHTASEVPATRDNPERSLLAAAIQGFCANPALAATSPEHIASLAKQVAAAAGGAP